MLNARRLLLLLAVLAAVWMLASADFPILPIPGWPHG